MFPVKVMIVFPAVLCSVTYFTCRLDGCDVLFSSYVQSLLFFVPRRQLRNPMSSLSWLHSFFFNSDVNRSAHLNLTRDKSGHVHSLSYGLEPNLDVCAV